MAGANPLTQHVLVFGQIKKQLRVGFQNRGCTGYGGTGIFQLTGGISGAAFFAVITVLIFGVAFWASAFHKPIRQKQIFLGIVQLGDLTRYNVALFFVALINQGREFAVFFGVG